MKVTDGQLDEAAQAARKVEDDRYGRTIPWARLFNETRDLYRKMALAVVATLPDAPEPIEGERRFVATCSESGSWEVMEEPTPGDCRHYGASFSNELPADCAAAMIRAAADAAERWHREQTAKERKRWRIAEGAPYRALGPEGKSVWFSDWFSERGADGDREACAAFVARENARLDAEEDHD